MTAGTGAALALLAAAAGCAAPRLAPAPAAAWRAEARALDSLAAAGRIDEAIEAARARRAAPGPAWRSVEARARERSLARRAALPESSRAALAAADRALLAALAPAASDSLAATLERCRRAWRARRALLGEADVHTAEAALALAEAEFRVAHVRESDSLAGVARASLAAALGPDHPRVGDAEDLLGRLIKNFTGRIGFDAALTHYHAALRIRSAAEGPRSPPVAETLNNLGNLYRLVQRNDEAFDHFRRALAIRRRALGPVHDEVASTLASMAFLRAGQGRWAEAEALVRESLVATPPGASIAARSMRLGLRGQMLRRLGRYDEAVAALREAVAQRESLWALSPRDAGSSVIAGLGQHRDLALALAGAGRGVEAFEALERGVSRLLTERLVGADSSGGDPWRGVLGRVQAVLGADEALLVWPRTWTTLFVADYPLWACVVRATGAPRWVRLERRTPAYPGLGTVRDAILTEARAVSTWPRRVTDTAPFDRLAEQWWRERFAPLEPDLAGARHLIVCSPDLVDGGPLGMMRDAGGRYLAERFTISHAPSALLLARSRERAAAARRGGLAVAPVASRPALLVGDPAYPPEEAGSWPRLAGAGGELEGLARRLPASTLLAGGEARAGRLRTLAASGALARYALIHFAAHAEIDPRVPLESGLVLAPETSGGESSRLAAREIAAGWRLEADLVSLAACRSMHGSGSQTEGLLGLHHAFLAAGARALLVSNWPVDDRATELLMSAFYARLVDASRPSTAAEALRAAQAAVRAWQAPDGSRPFAHPVYWVGFTLIGDAG